MQGSVISRHGIMLLLLLLILGASSPAGGVEQEASDVTNVTVTATKYDDRSIDGGGCYDTGCLPKYVLDGLLNDKAQSRWSCELAIASPIPECYMTFDLKRSFILDELIVYFHKSNDTGRDLNPFNISISADEETGYIYSFNGVNNGKTSLGTGENFSFPARSSGRYVRFTPILADEQWCSINEVEIYVTSGTLGSTSAPTVAPTPLVTTVEEASDVTNVTVTATKYDSRSIDGGGCYDTGCLPKYVLDGLLNEKAQSRWSCELAIASPIPECYMTFDLKRSFILDELIVYFHKSNDTGRDLNPFNISISADEETGYIYSFNGVNNGKTPLGTGENFSFPARSSGRYVRFTPILADEQWCSINEVEIYVTSGTLGSTSAPTVAPTPLVTTVEEASDVTNVTVTATKYDSRSIDGGGCYDTGCLPKYVLDGLLNDKAQSRWSCELAIASPIPECYMTFDLKRSFILDELIVYFHKSNDTGRDLNPFNISISADEETGYIYSFNGVNNGKTPLGTGENFSFPARSSGRYVRFTPILADEQWCSINEVEIYVTSGTLGSTSAPTVAPTPLVTTVEEASDVTNVTVTATKYDSRSIDGGGCYDTGCLPKYVLDGLLNDKAQSRWSCELAIASPIPECYMTFDLKRSFILDELIVYFHKSNDTGRDLNPFNISISADEETGYIYSFNGVNNGKTPLGTGENFSFPARSSGRYVRFTPILADEQWCSINEVEIYVTSGTLGSTSAPTVAPTSLVTTVEEASDVTNVTVTATKYDSRSIDGGGCYDTGCLPKYVLDGLLNDKAQSRWSCELAIASPIPECYMTFDLKRSFILDELIVYFHKSNDTGRDLNPFNISISADEETGYIYSFNGVNNGKTPLGTGENFSFPARSSGRYVRFTPILADEQWCSINEVEIYVTSGTLGSTSAPTVAPTPLVTTVEEASDVTNVTVTATKYDSRSIDGGGCYDTGCLPKYVLDGLLNDKAQSRWSCELAIASPIPECYMTFDLKRSFILDELIVYFHKSNDTGRDLNPFNISISADEETGYIYSFNGVNNGKTPLGTGENFSFPARSSGRYVRFTPILADEQWCSINEVEIYVTSGTLGPTSAPATLAPGSTSAPTLLGTPAGGLECANVTVSNTDGFDGLYVLGVDDIFTSTGTIVATIASSQQSAVCRNDSTSTCSITKWTIASEVDSMLMYVAYEDVEHPAQITEVWRRVICSSTTGCVNSPAGVEIVCGGGSTSGGSLSTPAPGALKSDCEIVEIVGTSGGELDGKYYDDGSSWQGGVTQFKGYDTDLTSNGNTLAANWTTGGCPSPSETGTGADGECSWRKWRITPDVGTLDAYEYFTFDEADHPADIAAGILWYRHDTFEEPYAGTIDITCAPADTPSLPTNSLVPSVAPTMTVIMTLTSVPTVAPVDTPTGVNDEGNQNSVDGDYIPMIIGSLVGAVAVLGLVGFVAYRKIKTRPPIPPPLPSYDDLVEGDGSVPKTAVGTGW